MICYSWWHLARILQRIIAHKKRSQYCHVIKERAPGSYVKGRILSCMCDWISDRIGKSLKIFKSPKHWDILNITESFVDLQDLRFLEVILARRISPVSFDSRHMCFENSSTKECTKSHLIVHLWQTGKRKNTTLILYHYHSIRCFFVSKIYQQNISLIVRHRIISCTSRYWQ